MNTTHRPQVLCLSRAYLSNLLPTLGQRQADADFYHVVQTDAEAAHVERLGGRVVLNIAECVRKALAEPNGPVWKEPADMREVTGFSWSPIYADRNLPSFPPAVRARIAGALQRDIAALFERHTFDGFLSEPLALFVTHLIFYHCRKSGTRPLLWATTYFPGYFYFADGADISIPAQRPGSRAVDESVRAAIAAYASGVVGDKAGPAYHHAFSGKPAQRLDYFKQRRGEESLVLRPGFAGRAIQVARVARAVWKRLTFRRNGDFITAGAVDEHLFYLRCLCRSSRLYDAMPEPSPDHVVYPLQYEPEASLLYFAPHIVSQSSFVETLLRALPAGKTLWVKEHPNQFGALGEPAWRALKKRYAALRFIQGRESGRELIKRSGLVVVISSSMGMDALLIGRTVVVAGNVFYAGFTGAVRAMSYEALAAAVNNPDLYHPTASFDANVAELAALARDAYPGDPQPAADLFKDANLDNLTRGIREALGSGVRR